MLHLIADPSRLSPGDYETTVSATVACKTCAVVSFHVLPAAQGLAVTGAETTRP